MPLASAYIGDMPRALLIFVCAMLLAPLRLQAADAMSLQQELQNWLNQQNAQTQQPAQGGVRAPRIEIILGELDPRLKLAPCAKVSAYVPRGSALWGRTRVGLRCEQGARWNIFWPVTVKVWGQALVAARSLTAGEVLEATDVAVAEVDLAAEFSPAITDVQALVGRSLARPLQAGQGVREADLRLRRWFSAGDPVRLVVRGTGFQAAATGTALAHGDEGRCARVRVDSGRVLCAQPVGERLAELSL